MELCVTGSGRLGAFARGRTLVALLLVACWLPALPGRCASGTAAVEILRDPWGIPHIFADTDESALYALGYATAEDRAFQMTYNLRIIQGRVSEHLGEVRQGDSRYTSVDHDRKMRTFGFYRAAKITAANLDEETLRLLEAYCAGVNHYFETHAGDLHPLFSRLEVKPEPWMPADCLASWWHLAQFFATDGTRDLISRRNQNAPIQSRAGRAGGLPNRPIPAGTPAPDDTAAVVKRVDVPAEWIERVEAYAREHGLRNGTNSGDGPRFSHAWVVGGKRTTTGSSVLVSDPQTPVRNPSLFYEYHIQGKTFNARGMGVPGSPIILIGFTDRVAWGVTALGADQADLFLLKTDATRPNKYFFDGSWRGMKLVREVIRVKGREPVELQVRETHLGPVATEFCFALPGEGEVALKRIPVCETNRETVQGAFAMLRAKTASEFDAALAGWRFPSANFVFGDAAGEIGYHAVAAIPVRSRQDSSSGRNATHALSRDDDWQEILPHDLLPRVMNPAAGFVYSANHRTVESWYPVSLGAMTGAAGDTLRSWRLRERLEAASKFSPTNVLEIHYDSVNPARREIVRLGLHLRDTLRRPLSEEASLALERLEPWYKAGALSRLTSEGAELATEISTFFRFVNTELAFVYGGGESGLASFLKAVSARIKKDPVAELSGVEQDYLDEALAGAWRSATEKYGADPANWSVRARQSVRQRSLGYMESLDRFPALDRSLDLRFPSLEVVDGGTIVSQAAQSYTQWVPMHDPDQALSVLPIGQSERPDCASRTSTMELWAEGKLHPAPLSREAVDKLHPSTNRLRLRISQAASSGEWVRPGINTNAPTWGIRGHLLWGIPPATGRLGGPRGLIRLWYPVLTNGGYDLINFIAIEPIVRGQRGFSELEQSAMDSTRGKRLFASCCEASGPSGGLCPGHFGSDGEQAMSLRIGVERFENGAHVQLEITQRREQPDELELVIHSEPEGAPIEYCILTATMGNKARARRLWLRDGIVTSRELYPNFKRTDFAPHRYFWLDRLFRDESGDVLVGITTDESNLAAADPAPAAAHWRYAGMPVTQYWRKPAGTVREDLHVAVNARYTYWMSRHPIPGGVSFENFELRERYQEGQKFVFGITRLKAEQLGLTGTRRKEPAHEGANVPGRGSTPGAPGTALPYL